MRTHSIRRLGLAALLVLSALQTACPPPWAYRDGRIERRGSSDRRDDRDPDHDDDRDPHDRHGDERHESGRHR